MRTLYYTFLTAICLGKKLKKTKLANLHIYCHLSDYLKTWFDIGTIPPCVQL